MTSDIRSLATDAYVFTYPLVLMETAGGEEVS